MRHRIFVISDTHFNHGKILKFVDGDNRPIREGFDSVEHMNEEMISRWNSVVRPEDKVYHLGDVYFGDAEAADAILKRLNGKKRLIVGNHDRINSPVLLSNFQKIMFWRIFREYGCVLSHVPLHDSTMGESSNFNVHGHIHQNAPPSERHICVCVEHINYTPVLLEDLMQSAHERTGIPLEPAGKRDN